jgi:hypothetical protein
MRMLKQTFSPASMADSVSSLLLTQSSRPGENLNQVVAAEPRHTRLTKAATTPLPRTSLTLSLGVSCHVCAFLREIAQPSNLATLNFQTAVSVLSLGHSLVISALSLVIPSVIVSAPETLPETFQPVSRNAETLALQINHLQKISLETIKKNSLKRFEGKQTKQRKEIRTMQNIDATPIIQNLTPEQLDSCREILDEHSFTDARDILAEPPPRGIGVTMSRATLCRLKKRLELEEVLSERQHIASDAGNILAPEETTAKIRQASFQTLRDKAFRLALSNEAEKLRLACRILQHVDKFEKGAARNIDMAEFHLKIAKRVLRRLDEFESIRSNKSYTEERIVTMFVDRLFDPLPTT